MSKRDNYLSWEKYFIGIAQLTAKRSKDPSTQVGCCIVDSDNRILSLGYNGFPRGCSDDEFPWDKNNEKSEDNKYSYVVHSELNAILNYKGESLKDSTLYVTLFPCSECSKAIIQSGIKKIVYIDEYKNDIASRRMFKAAGVELIKIDKLDIVL